MAGTVEQVEATQPRRVAHALALPAPLVAITLAAAALGAQLALGRSSAAPAPAALTIGALVFASGFVAVAWSLALMRSAGTPIALRAQPIQLIEEGPYRVSRHPMYLGITAMLLGAAFALGMPLMVLSALAFFAIVSRMHVPFEEAQMQARFGGWYRDYASTTRRWL